MCARGCREELAVALARRNLNDPFIRSLEDLFEKYNPSYRCPSSTAPGCPRPFHRLHGTRHCPLVLRATVRRQQGLSSDPSLLVCSRHLKQRDLEQWKDTLEHGAVAELSHSVL